MHIVKVGIGGAIFINGALIFLGIFVNPLFFTLLALNLVLIAIPVTKAIKENVGGSFERNLNTASFTIEQCKIQNDNAEFLLSAMQYSIKLFMKLNGSIHNIFDVASERLKNDKDFVLEYLKIKETENQAYTARGQNPPYKYIKIAEYPIGATLKQDREFLKLLNFKDAEIERYISKAKKWQGNAKIKVSDFEIEKTDCCDIYRLETLKATYEMRYYYDENEYEYHVYIGASNVASDTCEKRSFAEAIEYFNRCEQGLETF